MLKTSDVVGILMVMGFLCVLFSLFLDTLKVPHSLNQKVAWDMYWEQVELENNYHNQAIADENKRHKAKVEGN